MNEEDPERDRATQVQETRRGGGGGGGLFIQGLTQRTRRTPSATALPRCRRLVPPCYVPEGDSPLSLHGRREEGLRRKEDGGCIQSWRRTTKRFTQRVEAHARWRETCIHSDSDSARAPTEGLCRRIEQLCILSKRPKNFTSRGRGNPGPHSL